jgi:uncharacterized membrane protein YfcA
MTIYLRSNYLTPGSYWYVPGLLAVAFAGSFVGKVVLDKIEQKSFRKIVLALIFLIGLATLGRFVHQTMH